MHTATPRLAACGRALLLLSLLACAPGVRAGGGADKDFRPYDSKADVAAQRVFRPATVMRMAAAVGEGARGRMPAQHGGYAQRAAGLETQARQAAQPGVGGIDHAMRDGQIAPAGCGKCCSRQ